MSKASVGNLRVKILREKHINDGARILTQNFISSNPIWKHYELPYDHILVIMRGKLLKALQYDQSFVLYEGDKIIGLNIHLDIFDYVNLPNMPNNIDFFNKLSKVGQILQGSVNLSMKKRGEIIVGAFIVIDKEHCSKGYSVEFIRQSMEILKASGWKAFYARSSNIYSRKGLERLGASIVKQYQLVEENLKEKFWLIKIDLTKLRLKGSKLDQMMKHKNTLQPRL